MKYQRIVLVFELAFSTFALHADLTVRYKNDYKFGSLPPAMAGPLQKVQSSMPQFSVVKVKGNKGYSSNGNLVSLLDFGTQEITLLDAAGKRFATMPMKDYADKLAAAVPALPPQAQAMGMKPVSSTRKTGRTDTILGVQAEESETLFSIEALPDAAGSLPAGPMVREVIQIWTAKEQEVLRVPAVREWAGYTAYRNYLMDPVSALQKIFAGMPGFGQALSTMVEGSGKGGLVLKTHVEMYMPVLAALSSGNFDPNAAVMEATSEIVELSTAPVDEAIFQLPADYASASVGDILKSLTAPTATAAETPQRIRVGGNVQANNLVKKVTPVYPALAKQAGIEGTVRFTMVIDREGNVMNLQLVSGHPLLVEAAQEAVRQWQYKPTLLNGQPVEVVTQVDVNFTLQR